MSTFALTRTETKTEIMHVCGFLSDHADITPMFSADRCDFVYNIHQIKIIAEKIPNNV